MTEPLSLIQHTGSAIVQHTLWWICPLELVLITWKWLMQSYFYERKTVTLTFSQETYVLVTFVHYWSDFNQTFWTQFFWGLNFLDLKFLLDQASFNPNIFWTKPFCRVKLFPDLNLFETEPFFGPIFVNFNTLEPDLFWPKFFCKVKARTR